jgi:hypothetical protein
MNLLHLLDDSDFEEMVITTNIGIKLISRAMEQSTLPEKVKTQINGILSGQSNKEKILSIIEKIVEIRRSLRNMFKVKNVKNVFQSNESIIHLLKPCNSENDFNNLILVICGIINEDLDGFKNIVTLPNGKTGSIVALEEYLKSEYGEDGYNPAIIINLRDIFTLRSQKFPIHVDTTEWMKKAASLGFVPPINWQELGFKCLELYFESISNIFIKI